MLVAVVPNAEPAAEVDHGRRPAELGAGLLAERGEAVDGEEALVDLRQLRADVEVDAGHLEAEPARDVDRRERVVVREPELRPVVRGRDRLVRDRLDAGREAHEHPPHTGGRGALRLVRRVDHDRGVRLRRGPELLVRLVVAVEEQPVAGNAGAPRERQLAERRDVRADPLAGEDAQHLDVRERLRPVRDQRVRSGGAIGARLRPQRLLAVDEQRRPVLGREPRDGHSADRELAVVDAGGDGEEIEHDADAIGC